MTRYAAEGKRVQDVIVQELATGTQLVFPSVAEQAWAAIAYGSTALTLEVRVSNTHAQALYERFGFTVIGRTDINGVDNRFPSGEGARHRETSFGRCGAGRRR